MGLHLTQVYHRRQFGYLYAPAMPNPPRARELDAPLSTHLSRSEMAFAGIPDREMPFVRDHARSNFPAYFWLERDTTRRQQFLFDLLKGYLDEVKQAAPGSARVKALESGLSYAHGQWKASMDRLKARQVRRLAKYPNPLETGAVPTDHAGEPIGRAKAVDDERDMIRRAHKNDRPTQGEERWDPKWGDHTTELPVAMPQGMRRLPQAKDVPIPANPRRPEGGVQPGRPGKRGR